MLKLQSKDGKFDIVLSDASLRDVGSIKKTNVRTLSSAGRRKTREIKGNHVLPSHKDESPRQQLKHRESQLQTTAQSSEVKAEKADRDVSKRTGKSERTEKAPQRGASKIPNIRNTKTKSSTKERVGQKSNIKARSDNYQQTRSNGGTVKQDASVITQSQLMSIMESLKSGDTSVLQAMATINENQKGMVASEAKKPRVPNSVVAFESISEPMSVPGLDLTSDELNNEDHENRNYHFGADVNELGSRSNVIDGARTEASYTTSNVAISQAERDMLKHKDSISTISLNEFQKNGPTERMSPVHDESNITPRGKAERFAMRSSFAVGAPGQVAFNYDQTNRNKNKQWLADLEKQIQDKKNATISEKERLARAMENPSSLPPTARVPKTKAEPTGVQESSRPYFMENSPTVEKQKSEAASEDQGFFGENSSDRKYARGQHSTKNQFELDEIERQRQKILEHQKAVEQQVEEKRRLKMLEREKKAKEEREEEQRLAMERDQLARQYEEEARKQLEKEEAERQRHMALQQSVLDAYDAAQKEKQTAMLRKLKAGGHDVSKLEHGNDIDSSSVKEEDNLRIETSRLSMPSKSMDIPYQISSRSDKEFRPILNLMDDSYDSGKEKDKKQSKEHTTQKETRKGRNQKNEISTKKGKDVKVDSKYIKNARKQTRKNDPKRASIDSTSKKEEKQKKTDIALKKENQKNVRQANTDPTGHRPIPSKENPLKGTRKNDKPQSERLVVTHKSVEDETPAVTPLGYEEERSSVPVLEVSNENDEFENYGQYSLNRSSTVTLEESLSSRRGSHRHSASHQQAKDEMSTWDSWGFPTERQQQILEQLQALRKGLLDKQKEYERGTTPSTGKYQ